MAVNVRVVEEMVAKLRSDRHREREAGLKLLKEYVNMRDFSRLLDEQTERLQRQGQIPPSTWPGVVHALCEGTSSYLKTPKKKAPSFEYAKVLRSLVRRACASDKRGVLVRKLSHLYQHLVDTVVTVPSFQADYCAIVSDLLSEHEYRLRMKEETYAELVQFLLQTQTQPHDDAFLSIVKNPPGGIPPSLRPDVAAKLSNIFLHISDIKAGLKKALEAVTSLLRHDGPNLGSHLLEIHCGAKKCLFRSWATITDTATKDLFVLYLRMQLKLSSIVRDDETDHLEELFDFVVKELDGKCWDTKAVPLASSTHSFLMLAAQVIFEFLGRDRGHATNSSKRRKKESVTALITDRIRDLKPLWAGAICLLLRHYGSKLPQQFLSDVFQPLVQRLPIEAINVMSFEVPLWLIRCVNEICDIGDHGTWQNASLWQCVWEATIKWILLMSTVLVLVDEALKLLSNILLMNNSPAFVAPNEIWELHVFRDQPTRSALFFVSVLFSTAPCQDFVLRKSLLVWALKALKFQAGSSECQVPLKLISWTLLSLSVGALEFQVKDAATFLQSWSEQTEQGKVLEAELRELDLADEVLANCGVEGLSAINVEFQRNSLVSLSQSDDLLQILGEGILQLIQEVKCQRLESLLRVAVLVSYCFVGVEVSRKTRGHTVLLWSRDGEIFTSPAVLMGCCILRLESVGETGEASRQLTVKSLLALDELVSAESAGQTKLVSRCSFEGLLKVLRSLLEDGRVCESTTSNSVLNDAELDAPKRENWKVICISMICSLGRQIPEAAFHILRDLLLASEDFKVREKLIFSMCSIFTIPEMLPRLEELVEELMNSLQKGQVCDSTCFNTLASSQLLLSKLKAEKDKAKLAQVLPRFQKIIEYVSKVNALQYTTRLKIGEAVADLMILDATLAQDLMFLELLQDPDFRVRAGHASRIHILFETWSGHPQLLQDVQASLGVKLSTSHLGDTTEALLYKTAIIAIGEVAAASEQVEADAVCIILAQAALQPMHRSLVVAVLNKIAKQLGYTDRFKFFKQLLRSILDCWVAASFHISELLKVSDILIQPSNAYGFLEYCLPFILPSSFLHGQHAEIQQIAQERTMSVSSLVEENFASIFAFLAALDWGGYDKASLVLQSPLFETQIQREKLIKQHVFSIAKNIILLVKADAVLPSVSKDAAMAAVRAVAKGLFEDSRRQEVKELVFQILLEIHKEASSSSHWRHTRHSLEKLDAFLNVIEDGIVIPSTFRYMMHIILQSIEMVDLQPKCCLLINAMIDKLERKPQSSMWILGEHLQALVSGLVSCTFNGDLLCSSVLQLLHRVTLKGESSLSPYVKELNQLPDFPCFNTIREFQAQLRSADAFSKEFVKFVQKAPSLPSQLRLWSLRSFCNQLRDAPESRSLFTSDELVIAVWELVLSCNDDHDYDIKNLTAELLAAVGIGNCEAVVFHLPDANRNFLRPSYRSKTIDVAGPSEDILEVVLTQLCSYLLDKDVFIIDLAYQTAKGLLATKNGYDVLNRLNEQERAYLETHTDGPNKMLVNLVLGCNAPKSGKLEDSSVWSTSDKSYETWICSLVHALISYTEDTLLRLCQSLVEVKAALAEFLLPYALGSLAKVIPIHSALYTTIVTHVQDHIFSDVNKNTRSMQVFLEAFNSLRACHVKAAAKGLSQGTNTLEPLKWPKVYWLDVDYLLTAKTAQKCAAYFTSVLYVEHWCEENFGKAVLGERELSGDEDELPEHLERLLSVYTKVNEPDSIYGIIYTHNPISQVRLYEHEGNWGKALETYDLLLSSSNNTDVLKGYYKGVVRALQHSGCSQVRDVYSTGLRNIKMELLNDKEFKELQYEGAWKSGKWDLSFDMNPTGDDSLKLGFHGNLLSSFQCLVEGDFSRFDTSVKRMKEDTVSHVAHTSLESTQNVYPSIVKLQIVDCLPFAWSLRWPSLGSSGPSTPPDSEIQMLFTRWKGITKQTTGNYNLLEPFGSFMRVLLRVLQREDCLPCYLVEYAALARKAGRLNQAAGAIQELKGLCQGDNKRSEVLRAGRIEEAKVLWAQGQRELAVSLVKYLLTYIGSTDSMALYCLAGKWLAQTRSASSRVILESYLEKAVIIAETRSTSSGSSDFMKRRSKTHFHLAHFANALHRSYEDRLGSTEWQTELQLRNMKMKEYEALVRKAKESKDDTHGYSLKALEVQKELKLESVEWTKMHGDMARVLRTCLKSYRSCLLSSDKYDMRVVFRLVSLWFGNVENKTVINDMIETVHKVPSFKFLPLVYQIASRMGAIKTANDFQFAVASLVKKMAIEHPYHSLYQLLALANGDRIKENQKRKNAFVIDLEKKRAAEELLKELTNRHSNLIMQVRDMVEVYIKLAELEVSQQDCLKPVPYPRDIRSVRRLNLVPVLTANISVDRNCDYSGQNLPYFDGFEGSITVMRGVNVPKVVLCRGSDGQKYRQLAKSGGDDLRQDAVMEQLFGLVNTLLKDHAETRIRCLQIRTYKVVPFTPSAGALEWVNGTIPLGQYLLGSSKVPGAHTRYGVGDWTFAECREHIVKESNKSAAFQTVCKNFRPVFRYFFRENFFRAADWFEKRLNYTRSVAASSMVGYVVGLGDRHSMNILIDQANADVVHIDLGVAFDQGLMLKTPETIPFRLTRDVIDGMGVTGVEGVFRRCCEATLSVLRANKEALLTIIEVFIHDPLYRWALSPLKALQRQEGAEYADVEDPDKVEGNKDATRALMRVKQKLDGYRDGENRTVEGQVQQLVQDAQDPENLCLLFPGWAAWL